MELLCTLSKIKYLEKLKSAGINGIIFGSVFSLRFSYTKEEMIQINKYCIENNLKRYVSIDAFIFEDDRYDIYDYFEFLKVLNPDGIYFTDLGVISVAKKMDLADKLIYDPDTLMTNSIDAAFFIRQGIDVVLARELSFEEVQRILQNNKGHVDMQVFGHLKMSYSKRKFLSNYFKHLNSDIDVTSKHSIRIVEETRDYNLPIIEDDHGTRIYSDYVLLMYDELALIKDYINRAIVDDTFIENEIVIDTIKDLKRITKDNAPFIKESFLSKHKNKVFSNGYLDIKTSKTKEENE